MIFLRLFELNILKLAIQISKFGDFKTLYIEKNKKMQDFSTKLSQDFKTARFQNYNPDTLQFLSLKIFHSWDFEILKSCSFKVVEF